MKKNILRYLVLFLLFFYKKCISPFLGNHCRFEPSCSNYMIQMIQKNGLKKGFWLGIKQLKECHPWGK